MAFSYTTKSTVFGNKRVIIGTFTNNSSSTGGAIATGLKEIEYWGASNEVSATAVPYGTCSGGTLTITTAANECGKFIAIGN